MEGGLGRREGGRRLVGAGADGAGAALAHPPPLMHVPSEHSPPALSPTHPLTPTHSFARIHATTPTRTPKPT